MREMEKITYELKQEYGQLMTENINFEISSLIKFSNDYSLKHNFTKTNILEKFKNTSKLAEGELEERMLLNFSLDLENYFNQVFNIAKKSYMDNQNKLKNEQELRRQLAEQARVIAAQQERQRIEDEKRRKKENAKFWACKIFTLGIHHCGRPRG
jgi:hypothetical protein